MAKAKKKQPGKPGDTVKGAKVTRKEKRKLVKMRKRAYFQRQPIPSAESLAKEREEAARVEMKKEKSEKLTKKRKSQKRRDKRKKEEKVQEVRQAVSDGILQEEAEIRKYEKLLKLNKRKSKTISPGFRNDGLDCILFRGVFPQ